MKKIISNPYFLLVLIVIIAGFLRLYNIRGLPPGLYPDEAMDGTNAQEALSTGHFRVFYPENNGREGLFMNIQTLTISLFGNEAWALRIVSVFFGIFTVFGLYFLAKELFKNEKIALLSVFFLATSFWHIMFSRISFRAIMAPFFMTWALYFSLLSLNKTEESSLELGSMYRTKGGYLLYSLLGGIFFGLGFHSYIAFRAMPAVVIIVWLIYWFKNKDKFFRRKILASAAWFTILFLIVFAPLGIYFLKNPADFLGRTSELSIAHSKTPLKDLATNIVKTAGMFNFVGDWNWRHNFARGPELFWPVGIMFIIGLFLGLKIIFEKASRRRSGHGPSTYFPRKISAGERGRESSGESLAGARDRVFREKYFQSFFILFAWLIVAALPVVISNEGIPHALRSILMIPPVFILAGFGGIWIYEKIKNQILKIKDANQNSKFLKPELLFYFLTLAFFIWLAFNAYQSYFIAWGRNPNVPGAFASDYAQIGYELRNLPKDMPKYVVVETLGVDVRGIPMPAQTVMFLTDTFTPDKQAAKNIYYVLPNQVSQIPAGAGAYVFYLR